MKATPAAGAEALRPSAESRRSGGLPRDEMLRSALGGRVLGDRGELPPGLPA